VATNVGRSLIFLLSTGGPAESLHTTGGTLTFSGTLVEKHWSDGLLSVTSLTLVTQHSTIPRLQ